jgi:hypothetical protein
VDVLHHTDDVTVLLREAARVGRIFVLLKDHLCENLRDNATLRFMDWMGNRPHGGGLIYYNITIIADELGFNILRTVGIQLDGGCSSLSCSLCACGREEDAKVWAEGDHSGMHPFGLLRTSSQNSEF